MLRSSREQAKTIAGIEDPFARVLLRVAHHLRRYVAVCVLGSVRLVTLAILPMVGSSTRVATASTTAKVSTPAKPQAPARNLFPRLVTQ
jgi:hypothetical protein